MKKDRFFHFLTAAVMGAALSFGGVAALATGMEMTDADLGKLPLVCLSFAFLSGGILFYFPKSWLVFFLGGAAALGYGLFSGGLARIWQPVLYHIGRLYGLGYGFSVMGSSAGSTEPGLCMIGCIVGAVTVAVIRSQMSPVPALLMGLLPVGACMVLTDTVPEPWTLMLVAAAVAWILLTSSVRRKSIPDGNRLAALTLLPVGLCTALLFLLVPPEGPFPDREEALDRLLDLTPGWIQDRFLQSEDIPVAGIQVFPALTPSLNSVSLNNSLGPRTPSGAVALYVTDSADLPYPRTLYLRARAYDGYSGMRWYASETVSRQDFEDLGWNAGPETASALEGLTVETIYALDYRFLTYSPSYADVQAMQSLYLPNDEKLKTYTVNRTDPEEGPGPASQPHQVFGELPEETLEQALAYLRFHYPNWTQDDVPTRAEKVCQILAQEKTYDLSATMPADTSDFAITFLTQQEKGYCVHFATSAAVLLRAMGIPSRYVTGYIVTLEGPERQAVTGKQSHAWVEYFDSAKGWTQLEPTPEAEAGSTPEPTEPLPTQTEQPVEPTESAPQPTAAPPTKPSPVPDASTEASTTPTSAPETVPSQDVIPEKTPSAGPWLPAVLGIIGFFLLLLAQAAVRSLIFRLQREKGGLKRRILTLWKQGSFRCRLLKIQPPKALKDLAEKARFSNHSLTPAELQAAQRAYGEICRLWRGKKNGFRLWNWLIFGL